MASQTGPFRDDGCTFSVDFLGKSPEHQKKQGGPGYHFQPPPSCLHLSGGVMGGFLGQQKSPILRSKQWVLERLVTWNDWFFGYCCLCFFFFGTIVC